MWRWGGTKVGARTGEGKPQRRRVNYPPMPKKKPASFRGGLSIFLSYAGSSIYESGGVGIGSDML